MVVTSPFRSPSLLFSSLLFSSLLFSSLLFSSLLFSLPIQGGLYSSLSSPGTSCSDGPTDTNYAMVRLPKQCIGPIRFHEIVGRSGKPYYDLALRLAFTEAIVEV